MPGTRTAPTINGTPTYKQLSLSMIDFTGDLYSETFRIDAAAAPADIEAFVVAYQDATNASVYRADVQDVYRGVSDGSNNAANDPRRSVFQGVNLLFRQPDFTSTGLRIVAPLDALMVLNTDLVNPSAAQYVALVNAYLAIVTGTPDWESASYSERKETNTRARI